jgi:hypothetical protein
VDAEVDGLICNWQQYGHLTMDRQHILEEIRRTAGENGGKPLGRLRLETEAGIKSYHWQKYWPRLSDAQREAGFEPNERSTAYDESELLQRLATLAIELSRFPTHGDLRVKANADAAFPSLRTFETRLGAKSDMVGRLSAYCAAHAEFGEVLKWCLDPLAKKTSAKFDTKNDGFVYLMKSGKYYKIGRTNHVGRRERDLAIQLPDSTKTVHYIKTDDPQGIEAYWHNRFATKRKNGEWFDLDRSDIAAFRRRKFM